MFFLKKLFITLLLLSLSSYAGDLTDALRINGYGNVYIITSDDDNEQNNEKYMDTSGGIQARYQISDNTSTTAQIYFHENETNNRNDSFELEAKWLYIDYYLGYDLTARAGLFQFPIFKSAETGTIGYTMTWSETPMESYGANGYEDFLGVELLQKYFYKDFEFLIQLSYGASKNDLPDIQNGDTIEGETDSLTGITLKTTYDWFNFNIGYLQATSELNNVVEGPEEIDFYMYAFEGQADITDFAIKAGYINVKISDVFPNELRYYGSLEYNYKKFTPYTYYSLENYDMKNYDHTPNEVFTEKKAQKYSIGTRYDYSDNIAFKLSYQKKIQTMTVGNQNEKIYESIYKATVNVIF